MESWQEKLLRRAGVTESGTLGKSKPKAKQKYNARKVVVDGHVFQSQLEADYYEYAKAAKFTGLKVHPSVEVVAGIRYKPDFCFVEAGRLVYVDTKSDATAGGRFPTIKKLWREFGPGVLRIVYRGPRGTFHTKQEIHPKT